MVITKQKKIVLAVVLVIAGLIAGALMLGFFDRGEEEKEESPKYYSQLTGKEVDQELAERPVLAAIFNNSEEARPQTGLDSAGIVFETVTEGGITRYLAFYQEEMPDDIGPIRSLRSHFLDWAMGFDASFAHVGGSAEALEAAQQRDAKSLNQFSFDEPYYRTDDKPSPHNMYVRTSDLRDLQNELGHEQSRFKEIPRRADRPAETAEVTEISIDFSGPKYLAEFRYNSEDNNYTRHLAGNPHIDSDTDQPITVKNVIVIKTDRDKPVTSVAIGSGEALVFMNGRVHEARWEKNSYSDRLEIFSNEDDEIALNRGDTWFAVLSKERPVNY